MICVYCDTKSDFLEGFCPACQRYDGILSDSDDYFDEEVIDYYAEASLFGWDS